jgi:hypothetical protein
MNLETYWKRLVSACIQKKLVLLPLGKTGRQIIWMVKSRGDVPGKSILIAGGTHGDEIAGPLGILRFIEESGQYWFDENKLAFIPIVAPVAFKAGRRNGYTGRTNSGYLWGMKEEPSSEGEVLLWNMDLLLKCSRFGFLTLHETDHEENFYLYYYGETGGRAGQVAEEHLDALDIRKEGGKFFGLVPDGTRIYETGLPENFVRGGIVYNQFDGSFEHALWTLGCPISICTETPGRKPLNLRIEATVALIKEFIELRGGGGKG